MSFIILVHERFNHQGTRCRWICITGLREFEAVWTVKSDHRRVQRDSNSRGLFERVRSLRDNPGQISVYFNVLGEAAPFLIYSSTKGSCDVIADLYRDAEVGSCLNDNPCEVAPEDRSWAGATSGVYE